MLEALRKWTERNPLPAENNSGNQDDKEQGIGKNSKRDNLLQAQHSGSVDAVFVVKSSTTSHPTAPR